MPLIEGFGSSYEKARSAIEAMLLHYPHRPLTVVTAINEYLDPFARGRDVNDIEDIWQAMYQSSYWRNGPVLNNCISGLDQALFQAPPGPVGVAGLCRNR